MRRAGDLLRRQARGRQRADGRLLAAQRLATSRCPLAGCVGSAAQGGSDGSGKGHRSGRGFCDFVASVGGRSAGHGFNDFVIAL